MKKKVLSLGMIAVLIVGAMTMMTGCGEKAPYSGCNFSEYVKVGEYKGLEYKKINVSVSDKEVEAEIQNKLEAAAEEVTVTTGTVEDGDTIDVAFEGKIDGETFEGGSSESSRITIGTTQMIEGFVEGLIGKKVGETVTLDLQFPVDYGVENLAGKPVVFTVTINSKIEPKLPEYNLEFVTSTSDHKSVAEYEKAIKKELEEAKKIEKETELKGVLWEQIVNASELIQYSPEKDETIASMKASFEKQAEKAGKTLDAYLSGMGYTEETLTDQITAFAETKAYQELLIYAIAEEEGLEVTDEEYDTYMKNVLAQSGYDEATFEQYYGTTIEEYCEQEGLRSAMLLDKVMIKVLEYAKPV